MSVRLSDCFEILLWMVRADPSRQQVGMTKMRVTAGRRERIDDSESVDLKARRSLTDFIPTSPILQRRTLTRWTEGIQSWHRSCAVACMVAQDNDR